MQIFQSVDQAIEALLTKKSEYDIETDEKSFVQGLEQYLAERITNSMFSKQPEIKVINKNGDFNEEATKSLLVLLEEQDFYQSLIALSQEVSISGVGGLLIQSNSINKTYIIPVSSRHMFLPTFDQYGEMIELQLTRKMFSGAKPYFTQQHFTPSNTKTLFGTSATGVFSDYTNFNKDNKLFANSKFLENVPNRLDKLPIGLFTNKIYKPNLITSNPELIFSTLATAYNGKALIPRMMQVWKQLGSEIHRGRTLLLSTDSAPDINGDQIQNKINNYNNSDMLNLIDGENIDYVGGNFQGVTELRKEFKELFNDWLRQNFVSSNSNFAGKNNKNDLEVYQGSREEIQFIENRVMLMQKAIRNTLKLYIQQISILGNTTFTKEQDIVVNIITNEVRDSMQETQKYIQLHSAGLIPKYFAVKNSLSISEKDAEIIVEQVNKELEKQQVKEMELSLKQNSNNKIKQGVNNDK